MTGTIARTSQFARIFYPRHAYSGEIVLRFTNVAGTP
jgi:hypothetical protein